MNSNYWLMGGKRFVVGNYKSPTSKEIMMEIFSDPGLKNGVLCVRKYKFVVVDFHFTSQGQKGSGV